MAPDVATRVIERITAGSPTQKTAQGSGRWSPPSRRRSLPPPPRHPGPDRSRQVARLSRPGRPVGSDRGGDDGDEGPPGPARPEGPAVPRRAHRTGDGVRRPERAFELHLPPTTPGGAVDGQRSARARGPRADDEARDQGLATWAGSSKTGDMAELDWAPTDPAWQSVSVSSEECPGAQRCPMVASRFAEAARNRAAAADIIVVNTHLYGLNVAAGGAAAGSRRRDHRRGAPTRRRHVRHRRVVDRWRPVLPGGSRSAEDHRGPASSAPSPTPASSFAMRSRRCSASDWRDRCRPASSTQ